MWKFFPVLWLVIGGSVWAAEARITVDANGERGVVSPLIFGQNIEAADEFGIFSEQHNKSENAHGLWEAEAGKPVPVMLALAKELKVGALRYPGGCLVHNFNWQATIGPVAGRPDFRFGLDEWLELCRLLGAEPVYTVADYFGTADDAAALVEYLNAPANDRHPWAMKRAANGHPEPYGVKWFELGNESDHGNHQVKPSRKFSAEEYVAWAREYARRMKAVDAGIKVGVVTPPGDGRDANGEWNQTVLRGTGDFADFVVVHFYVPHLMKGADLALVNQACMAQTEQLGVRLRQYREMMKASAGRELPIAITEFNVAAADVEQPVAYRFSFAAALQSVDLLRLCLGDEQFDSVVMTNYWQIFNAYWGAVRGTEVKHPAFALFRLWGKYRGEKLLTVSVESPRGEFGGYGGTAAAGGEKHLPDEGLGPVRESVEWRARNLDYKGVKIRGEQGGFEMEFADFKESFYPELLMFEHPADGAGYRYELGFEAKFAANGEGEFRIGVEDGRGWEATKSAIGVDGIQRAAEWKKFRGVYEPLPDGKMLRVLARLEPKAPVNGRLSVRNLQVTRLRGERMPAYPLLTVTAMKSAGGEKLYLLVFNKSLDRTLTTEIAVENFAVAGAEFEQLTAANGDAASTGLPVERKGKVAVSGKVLTHQFPPCSMTALVLEK